ncbi:MAG: hypothetical protein LUH22_19815 [Bacteroides sp.]|nr:hypothetical protein [Bacteroides sp.]
MNFNNLYISQEAYEILKDIAKWAKFLAIVVFVLLGLSALCILTMGILITSMNSYAVASHNMMYHPGIFSWMHAIFMLITFLIYFIPTYFLYKFAVNLKRSLTNNSTMELTKALNFLRKHYSFIGVLTVIMITILLISVVMMFFSMFAIL